MYVVDSPVRNHRSVDSLVRNRQYVDSQIRDRQYVDSPIRDRQYVDSPIRDRQYVDSLVRDRQYVDSPFRDRQYVDSPVRDCQFVDSPVRDRQFVDLPVRDRQYRQPSSYVHEVGHAGLDDAYACLDYAHAQAVPMCTDEVYHRTVFNVKPVEKLPTQEGMVISLSPDILSSNHEDVSYNQKPKKNTAESEQIYQNQFHKSNVDPCRDQMSVSSDCEGTHNSGSSLSSQRRAGEMITSKAEPVTSEERLQQAKVVYYQNRFVTFPDEPCLPLQSDVISDSSWRSDNFDESIAQSNEVPSKVPNEDDVDIRCGFNGTCVTIPLVGTDTIFGQEYVSDPDGIHATPSSNAVTQSGLQCGTSLSRASFKARSGTSLDAARRQSRALAEIEKDSSRVGGWCGILKHRREYVALRRLALVLQDNRLVTGSAETKRKLRHLNRRRRSTERESCRLLKRALNVLFITTGVSLLVAVVVVIAYTSVGRCCIHYLHTSW